MVYVRINLLSATFGKEIITNLNANNTVLYYVQTAVGLNSVRINLPKQISYK